MNRAEMKQETDKLIEYLLNLSEKHLNQKPILEPKVMGQIYHKLKGYDMERLENAFKQAGIEDFNYSFNSLTISKNASSTLEMLASKYQPPKSSRKIERNKYNSRGHDPNETLEQVRARLEKRKAEWYGDPGYPEVTK